MKFLTKALFAAGAALGGGAAALNACVVARTAPAVRRLSDLDGRSADAILVLGAGVEPDGRMSDMLADRVEVAIALYRRGAAGSCCSAATARPGYDEPAAMRRAVLRAGVPEEALLLDRPGGIHRCFRPEGPDGFRYRHPRDRHPGVSPLPCPLSRRKRGHRRRRGISQPAALPLPEKTGGAGIFSPKQGCGPYCITG